MSRRERAPTLKPCFDPQLDSIVTVSIFLSSGLPTVVCLMDIVCFLISGRTNSAPFCGSHSPRHKIQSQGYRKHRAAFVRKWSGSHLNDVQCKCEGLWSLRLCSIEIHPFQKICPLLHSIRCMPISIISVRYLHVLRDLQDRLI